MCANDEEFRPSDERVQRVFASLKTRTLCDHCLGRLVGKVGHGYSNAERGRMIREELLIPPISVGEKCRLCGDIFERLDEMAASAIEALKQVEYESFAIGSRYDPNILNREESIWAECGGEHAEPIKSEVNREVGKRVESLTDKRVDIENHDVIAIVDINFLDVQLEISSLFIYGRYKKFERGIPQTKWPCRKCQGKGCKHCDFTGKMYGESIEELMGEEFLKETKATGTSFHGMGREDIDARMLGNGRPFVLELKKPKIRNLDLEELENRVNKANEGRIEISNLRPSSKEEVRALKESKSQKSYRAVVKLDREVDYTKLIEVMRLLKESTIEQRTPSRVSHRRGDRVRTQHVAEAELEKLDGEEATIRIRAAAGTYIKELMNGDEGRTRPNLAELLETKVEVLQLDVIEIHDESDRDGESI